MPLALDGDLVCRPRQRSSGQLAGCWWSREERLASSLPWFGLFASPFGIELHSAQILVFPSGVELALAQISILPSLKELGGATGLTASATTASSYSKMYHRCASLPARSTQRAEPRPRLLVAAAGLALARQYDAAGTHTSGRRRTHPAAAGLKGAATGANARAQRRRPDAERQPVARHPSPGWTSASRRGGHRWLASSRTSAARLCPDLASAGMQRPGVGRRGVGAGGRRAAMGRGRRGCPTWRWGIRRTKERGGRASK